MDYNRFDASSLGDAYGAVYEGNQRDPEKGKSEYEKKYGNVRGEKTPMPPRGDKRREDFEKWYAKNVREQAEAELLEAAWDVFSEEEEMLEEGEGKKDACYHKVKSRYSVWPSAYASGALVKCRKKGADNWGNSSKK